MTHGAVPAHGPGTAALEDPKSPSALGFGILMRTPVQPPGLSSPYGLGQGVQRALGHHHVTGEALLLRVLGDEAKVPAERGGGALASTMGHSWTPYLRPT